jgi:hypothetical protein
MYYAFGWVVNGLRRDRKKWMIFDSTAREVFKAFIPDNEAKS